MRMMRMALLAGAAMLSACSGMGPQPVVTRNGAIVDPRVRDGILRSGAIYNFMRAERLARPYTGAFNEDSPGARLAVPASNTRDMLTEGFTAISMSCEDFFRSSGRDQTRLLVLRDIISTLSSLAGGALAMIDASNEMGGQGNENALAAIALASTASLSGIDIYTQHFLFGAENVSAVRDLTLRALATHRAEVMRAPPESYNVVLEQLADNQHKCSLPAIASLSRDAISRGQLVADPGTGSARVNANQTQDEAVLAELGRILDLPRPLTADEAGALWWLLAPADPAATAAEIAGPIKTKLKDLPVDRSPFAADGTRRATWTPSASVRALLLRLSEPTLLNFALQVEAARRAPQPVAAPTPLIGNNLMSESLSLPNLVRPAPVAPFRLAPDAAETEYRRVEVRVRDPN
jgi:hypothetical protein